MIQVCSQFPIKKRNKTLDKAMLDLGSSINVMSRSLFEQLKVGELKRTGLVIYLADRSCAYPDGVIEDVLVQVDKLIFPTDLFILDMCNASNDVPILLGRLFSKTTRTKIVVHTRTMSMEFYGDIIKFDIFDAIKLPSNENHICVLDVIDEFPKTFMTCRINMSQKLC